MKSTETAKHTPGPWKFDGLISGPDRGVAPTIVADPWVSAIADACKPKLDEQNANAQLIATAPELLEALEGMLAFAEAVRKEHPDEYWLGSEYNAAWVAIRKAKGEL